MSILMYFILISLMQGATIIGVLYICYTAWKNQTHKFVRGVIVAVCVLIILCLTTIGDSITRPTFKELRQCQKYDAIVSDLENKNMSICKK